MCSGHGQCDDGISGSGKCACNSGWYGDHCGWSNQLSCNGHGQVDASNGKCNCDIGFTPSGNYNPLSSATTVQCNNCTSGYYGPNCVQCDGQTCLYGGTCDLTGAKRCICTGQRGGDTCAGCEKDYYAYNGICIFCRADITCSGVGTCSNRTGSCFCSTGYAGINCESCAKNYYGPTCKSCPSFNDDGITCSGNGDCIDGHNGTGECVCNGNNAGPYCNSPILSSVTPARTPTKGTQQLHLSGYHLKDAQVWISGYYQDVQCISFVSFDEDVICTTQGGVPPLGPRPARIWVIGNTTGLESTSLLIQYDAPTVTGLSPNHGPVDGSTSITITGSGFGVLTYNQTLFPSDFTLHLNVVFACTSPDPFGAQPISSNDAAFIVQQLSDTTIVVQPTESIGNCTVAVKVSNVLATVSSSSTSMQFMYDAPSIVGVTGVRATQGGSLITIWGDSFRRSGAEPTYLGATVVTMDGQGVSTGALLTCDIARGTLCDGIPPLDALAPLGIMVYLPAGNLNATITVRNLFDTRTATFIFYYDRPVVYSVSGCGSDPINFINGTIDCETQASTTLLIKGANFGNAINGLDITIGGRSCTAATPTHNQVISPLILFQPTNHLPVYWLIIVFAGP
jgi:hypothetical protein